MIVRGAVPKEVRCCSYISGDIDVNVAAQEALGWKQSIKDYIAENPGRVAGQFVVLTSQNYSTHYCAKVSLSRSQHSMNCTTQRHKFLRELTPD